MQCDNGLVILCKCGSRSSTVCLKLELNELYWFPYTSSLHISAVGLGTLRSEDCGYQLQ